MIRTREQKVVGLRFYAFLIICVSALSLSCTDKVDTDTFFYSNPNAQ